ncbi:MAG: alpha-L-rhamnosidase C-terminal domain-containing protein [Omnitrophica WOR_2 bacterium]
MRSLIDRSPDFSSHSQVPWEANGTWPCSWINHPGEEPTPYVHAFRLNFHLDGEVTLRAHISADERYELFLDGKRLGRGPERGDPRHWFFETYDLHLAAGNHCIVARVWALGNLAPIAQFSVHPGFLFCPEEEKFWDLLGTGRAAWQVKKLEGFTFVPTPPQGAFAVGHKIVIDGRRFPWGFERGEGEDWLPAHRLQPAVTAERRVEYLPWEHLLYPATLPAMLDEPRLIGKVRHISAPALSETYSFRLTAENQVAEELPAWEALLHGQAPLTLPANTRRRVILDLENYYCAYPEVVVTGGEDAFLRIHWQESLVNDLKSWDKGNRGEVEGKYFSAMWWLNDGVGDAYHLDGGAHRRLDSLWWQAGRYVELLVETGSHPLTIESLVFYETRYPLERESDFSSSDQRLEEVIPIGLRALQMCAHETYMDCPFYEQLMYAGDTRLECLITYTFTHDDYLPRKALRMFDYSRTTDGFTPSRYPSRARQIVPPFSLWWVAMVHDYLYWRDDMPFVRSLLPGMRAVLDAFHALRDGDGLVHSPECWNFIDWVPEWKGGIPPGGEPGEICGPLNWQYVYALQLAARVEQDCGEPELAGRDRRLAQQTVTSLVDRYWDADKGLYGDNLDHSLFTEHSQCLAVLSRQIPDEQRDSISEKLFTTPGLTPPTVYFMHYLFETCRELGRMDVFFQRMQYWFEMKQFDFKTTYETGNPHTTRSDCHAWGAHPLYHYFASILGIRPASPGFNTVEVRPQLSHLNQASGTMVHPAGVISVEYRTEDGKLHGKVQLPEGISGWLLDGDQRIPLHGGLQKF